MYGTLDWSTVLNEMINLKKGSLCHERGIYIFELAQIYSHNCIVLPLTRMVVIKPGSVCKRCCPDGCVCSIEISLMRPDALIGVPSPQVITWFSQDDG